MYKGLIREIEDRLPFDGIIVTNVIDKEGVTIILEWKDCNEIWQEFSYKYSNTELKYIKYPITLAEGFIKKFEESLAAVNERK